MEDIYPESQPGVTLTFPLPRREGTELEFFANGARIHSDSSVPYSLVWRPTTRGTFTITARAYGFDGGVTTSAPVTIRVK